MADLRDMSNAFGTTDAEYRDTIIDAIVPADQHVEGGLGEVIDNPGYRTLFKSQEQHRRDEDSRWTYHPRNPVMRDDRRNCRRP